MKKKSLINTIVNAPYAIWATIFIIVPLVIVCYYAFTDKAGHFTFDNIKQLTEYSGVFGISLLYSAIATVITLLLAYPFAYFLSKRSENSQRMQMLLVMLPMWMNLLIRTYSWMNILEKNGIINNFLGLFGLDPVTMIGTPGAVILGMVYNYLPYMILPIYTVMSKMDNTLIEAARDLGCNGFNTWKRLILPLSIPGVVSGIAMVFVPSVSTFYISQKLGGGTIMLIGDTIERQMQVQYNYNLGAALSLVLMVLILVSMMIMSKFSDDDMEGGLVA
ncbi:MAG: ABC transporter permease [Clostridia bacterium]|nr:ABC transporter permease [Clostridia bacterium]